MSKLLYTTPGCERCEELKSFMQSKNIAFEEKVITEFYEIDPSPMSKLIEEGYDESSTVMPVLIVDNHVYTGGDVENLKNIASV